jgi:hypothetical protein
MTGFALSPGITPALVSVFSVELPLVLGLAYVFFRGRGFEFALALNAIVLGAIKLYTDYSDFYDVLVALAALLPGVVVLAKVVLTERLTVRPLSRPLRGIVVLVAVYAIPFGLLKIFLDFYDPFDTFMAVTAIVAGALLLRWLFGRPSSSQPA